MTHRWIRVVLFWGPLALVLSSCGTTPQPAASAVDTRAQDEATIRAAAQDWGKAIVAKNLDQTLSYYAEDAWVNPQSAPIAKTPEERRAVWSAFFATPGLADMEGETARVEVARSGDLAAEYGTFTMTLKDNKGKPATQTEKYIVTWKKHPDGQWKAAGDIWNADK
jgi:ketosteroid isomerase-like protein